MRDAVSVVADLSSGCPRWSPQVWYGMVWYMLIKWSWWSGLVIPRSCSGRESGWAGCLLCPVWQSR